MATSVLMGILSGLGNLGEQQGEARQINAEDAIRKAQLKNQQSELQLRQTEEQRLQQEAQQHALLNQLTLTQAKQPIALGNPFVSKGKTYQRYQSPVDGAVSVQELPGDVPETADETKARGWKALGFSDDDVRQMLKQGKSTAETKITQPDPKSPTGYSEIAYDHSGTEVWRAPIVPPRGLIPSSTTRSSTDSLGLTTNSTTTRTPILPGAVTPKSSPAASANSGGTSTLPRASVPQVGVGGTAPQGGASSLNIGTYRGLDTSGNIPETAKVNPQVREYANDILQGRDVTKIPAKARGLAESVARAYGWKGQGSLNPAQQMQIEQVDNSLKSISDPASLSLFNPSASKILAATIPIDPTTEGGLKGALQAIQRIGLPQAYADYVDKLIRLRGVITGIRGFTGANNSNATADRLLGELPTFTNTKNAQEAALKLQQLQKEVAIIKRLGYFLPEQGPAVGDKVSY